VRKGEISSPKKRHRGRGARALFSERGLRSWWKRDRSSIKGPKVRGGRVLSRVGGDAANRKGLEMRDDLSASR